MLEPYFTPERVAVAGASGNSNKMSHIAVNHPEIAELEMNPLYVLKDGDMAFAIDIRGSRE